MHSAQPAPDIREIHDRIQKESAFVDALFQQMATVVVGQRNTVERLLIGLLTGGHVLLEGVPGLAKTLVIRTLADALDGTFSRIQFTPDMRRAFRLRDGAWTTRPSLGMADVLRGSCDDHLSSDRAVQVGQRAQSLLPPRERADRTTG